MILHRLARTTTRHTLSLSVTVLLSWCSIGPVNSGSFPAEVCSSSPPPLYIYFPLSKLKKKKKTKLEKLETLADKYLRAPRHEEEERIKEFGAWLEIRSLERGTEFLFRPGKGLQWTFFTSLFFLTTPSADKELIVTSYTLLIGTRMKFTSYRRNVPFLVFPPPSPSIYTYIQCIQCDTFSSFCFSPSFHSERVIRSSLSSIPSPFFPSPPSDRFRPPFSPSEPRTGTKRERKRAEQGERRKRIRQVASGASFTDRGQRSFERRWKISLFERSLEKSGKIFQKFRKKLINQVETVIDILARFSFT